MEARCDKLLVATTSKPLGTATINLLYREINEWVSAPLTLPLLKTHCGSAQLFVVKVTYSRIPNKGTIRKIQMILSCI